MTDQPHDPRWQWQERGRRLNDRLVLALGANAAALLWQQTITARVATLEQWRHMGTSDPTPTGVLVRAHEAVMAIETSLRILADRGAINRDTIDEVRSWSTSAANDMYETPPPIVVPADVVDLMDQIRRG